MKLGSWQLILTSRAKNMRREARGGILGTMVCETCALEITWLIYVYIFLFAWPGNHRKAKQQLVKQELWEIHSYKRWLSTSLRTTGSVPQPGFRIGPCAVMWATVVITALCSGEILSPRSMKMSWQPPADKRVVVSGSLLWFDLWIMHFLLKTLLMSCLDVVTFFSRFLPTSTASTLGFLKLMSPGHCHSMPHCL